MTEAQVAQSARSDRAAADGGQLGLVQSLRGLAAFAVLIHHIAGGIDIYHGAQFTPPGIGLGWVGVDLFFVLSGFIMVWTTRTVTPGPAATVAFWTRRVVRVYPPYWAALALAAVLLAALPALAPRMGEADILHSIFLLPAADDPLVSPGWTLIYELWFYIGFGVLLLAPRTLLGWLLAAWAIAVVAGRLAIGADPAPALHVITNPLTLNFLMGAFVALAMARKGELAPNPRFALLAAAIASLSLFAGAWYVTAMGWNDWTRMLACGPSSALLLAAAAHADRHALLPAPRSLMRLGDWSYALYLTHHPIVMAAILISLAIFGAGSVPGMLLAAIIGVALSFAATAVVHAYIEKPAQNWGRALARRAEKA